MSPQPRRRSAGRRRRRLHPVAISLMLIAGCAFVVFYAFNQGLPFVHHFTLHAVVSNSVNVRQDSPVRIAGADVGTVTGVSPAGRSSEITFTLNDSGLPIHKDATLRIRDRLFLEGGYYLELNPGSPSAPIATDGFTIPQSQTTTPVQFYKVLSTFDVATRTNLKNLLETLNQGFSAEPGHPLSDSGAGGFKTAIPPLTPVLKDVAWISHALHGLLSQVHYPRLSGTNVARDFVELPSQLFEHWLEEPAVLERFARHHQTGEPIPKPLLEKLLAARNYGQGFATVEFLASALIDMDFHTLPPGSDPKRAQADTLARIDRLVPVAQVS